MFIEERTTIEERRKYLHSARRCRERAVRLEQGRLLDEMDTLIHRP